jgi:putative ABC transport system permease protein
MIKNYVKTAFRSLKKNVGFTLINVFGLALGLATCLLILFYVFDELSYDRYNVNADRIYRVNFDIKFGGNASSYAITPPPLAGALTANFPEVEKAARLYHDYGVRVRKGNEYIQEEKVVYADPGIFDIFSFPAVEGNPVTGLAQPNTVAITASTAKKYFNKTNVIGQTLWVNNKKAYKIVAVLRDLPKQSHFDFDFFISLASRPENTDHNWYSYSVNTYMLLRPNADYKKLETKFPNFIKKVALHPNDDLGEKSGNYFKMNLTPLTEIHLQSNRQYELGINGNIQYVYIFGALALFILLVACINFMNLSTARSSKRAREVGVRKVLGSTRQNLIFQFLSESIIVTLAAALLALLAAYIMLPWFNQLSGKSLTVPAHYLLTASGALLVITLFVGVFAGAYPAFFLSGFKPISVLKGKLPAFEGVKFRSFLVVFQFAISIVLIIGTVVIYNQLRYIQNKNLGYNRHEVLVIKNTQVLNNQAKTLQQQIKQLPGVESVTMSGYLPTTSNRNPDAVFSTKVANPKSAVMTEIWSVDENYINTLGMQVLQGRNFSPGRVSDSTGIIINEAAAKLLGYLADPLNKKLYTFSVNHNREYTIIGVVKDFNFNSLKSNVTPVVMILGEDRGALSVKVNTANIQGLVGRIENSWKGISPNQHFNYSFMDADFDALYHSEQRMGKLFVIFTSLSIIIACLGLFGLAAHAAEQRDKEIGIRKVLGADVLTIVLLLSKAFIRLVVIAILIATPIAWLLMNRWLQDFAYRITVQWWMIFAAGLGAVAIAVLTISYQSIKAASVNPVKSLRSE